MTEYLDNLLAIHHLFDKAVDFTKIPLLFYKEISGKSGHLFVTPSMIDTITSVVIVSGMFRISILTKTLTIVIALLMICGILD